MAFTSWADMRDAIKEALMTYVEGSPCTGSYTINGKTHQYRSVDELKKLYKMTYEFEAMDQDGGCIISYGNFGRYR